MVQIMPPNVLSFFDAGYTNRQFESDSNVLNTLGLTGKISKLEHPGLYTPGQHIEFVENTGLNLGIRAAAALGNSAYLEKTNETPATASLSSHRPDSIEYKIPMGVSNGQTNYFTIKNKTLPDKIPNLTNGITSKTLLSTTYDNLLYSPTRKTAKFIPFSPTAYFANESNQTCSIPKFMVRRCTSKDDFDSLSASKPFYTMYYFTINGNNPIRKLEMHEVLINLGYTDYNDFLTILQNSVISEVPKKQVGLICLYLILESTYYKIKL